MSPLVHRLGWMLLGSGLLLAALGTGAGCEKKSDVAEGRPLFASTCARCHGESGNGGTPLFDGGPAPRNFHDHDFQRGRTDEQLKQIIANGKGVGMPQFGTTFDDAQLSALVAQVRSFDDQAGATK
jgi:mono/diheme cytochrome c family protein